MTRINPLWLIVLLILLACVLVLLVCQPSKAHCAVCESPHYHVYLPYMSNDDCGPARYCTPEPPEPCPYPGAGWCER
jgi:hypothetical protein